MKNESIADDYINNMDMNEVNEIVDGLDIGSIFKKVCALYRMEQILNRQLYEEGIISEKEYNLTNNSILTDLSIYRQYGEGI